jgi:hypothetical protein
MGPQSHAAGGPTQLNAWHSQALLSFLPHLATLRWRRLASALWLSGAVLTAAWTLANATSHREQVMSFGILVLPWTLAAHWIASPEQ